MNMMHGHEFAKTAHWQGDSLVTIMRDPQLGFQRTEKRTLAKNGKFMTITVVSGLLKQKVVMLKK